MNASIVLVITIILSLYALAFVGESIEESLYMLAEKNYQSRKTTGSKYSLSQVHLFRIPKGGSTSLSILARRLVGCEPPGPCCKFPGDPPGSCPDRRLFECQQQKKVIGCTGHDSHLQSLRSQEIPTITMMRNPISRSISGFFYPNHHNMNCHLSMHHCLIAYLRDRKYQNVMVKMLTGEHPYSFVITCSNSSECPHSLETAITNLQYFQFIGILEMWELSLLLFHHLYPSFPPQREEFLLFKSNLNATNSGIPSNQKTFEISRVNQDSNYLEFRENNLGPYTSKFASQNLYDLQLYDFVIKRFCHQLQQTKLWEYSQVQQYWKEKFEIEQSLHNITSHCIT